MEPEVVDLANFLVAMGAQDFGTRHRHDRHRRRRRTARRRIRNHSRPHRDRHAAARGRRYARRRHRHRMPSGASAQRARQVCRVRRGDDDRRRLDSRASRRHHRRHRHAHRTASRISDRFAAADGRLSVRRARNQRRRRIDLQRALLVRQRTRAHGRRRQGCDGKQHGGHQGRRRSFPARRSKRPTSAPAQASSLPVSRPRAKRRSSASSTSIAATNGWRSCSRSSADRCSAAAASRRSSNPTGFFETSEYPRR